MPWKKYGDFSKTLDGKLLRHSEGYVFHPDQDEKGKPMKIKEIAISVDHDESLRISITCTSSSEASELTSVLPRNGIEIDPRDDHIWLRCYKPSKKELFSKHLNLLKKHIPEGIITDIKKNFGLSINEESYARIESRLQETSTASSKYVSSADASSNLEEEKADPPIDDGDSYVNEQYKAFNNGEEININIRNPKEFESRLRALNELMKKINNSSKFGRRVFLGKHNWQTTIHKQVLEKAEQYAAAKFAGGGTEKLEFWKKLIKEPVFNMSSHASFFHSQDEKPVIVQQIIRDKNIPLASVIVSATSDTSGSPDCIESSDLASESALLAETMTEAIPLNSYS